MMPQPWEKHDEGIGEWNLGWLCPVPVGSHIPVGVIPCLPQHGAVSGHGSSLFSSAFQLPLKYSESLEQFCTNHEKVKPFWRCLLAAVKRGVDISEIFYISVIVFWDGDSSTEAGGQ